MEDTLHTRESPRSKVDFYKEHLYFQILVQLVHAEDEVELHEAAEEMDAWHMAGDVGSAKGVSGHSLAERGVARFTQLPEGVEGVFKSATPYEGKGRLSLSKRQRALTVDKLSAKYMIPIRTGLISGFLMRDGEWAPAQLKPLSCNRESTDIRHTRHYRPSTPRTSPRPDTLAIGR